MTERKLCSDELTVWITASGSRYRRSRFDRTGQVFQVALPDGTVFLGGDGRPFPYSCGGFGLLNEFMPSDQGSYEQAETGCGFLKMGVGVLCRVSTEPYSQKQDYPYLMKPPVTEEFTDVSCHSGLIQPDFMGWSYILEKEMVLRKNRLMLTYRLKNTGGKELRFCEYAHNFYRPGKNGGALQYRLSGNLHMDLKPTGVLTSDGGLMRLLPFTETAACELMGWQKENREAPFYAELMNPAEGLRVRETVEADEVRCYLWALPDTVCPELIVREAAEPGQTICWKRTWCFERCGQQDS